MSTPPAGQPLVVADLEAPRPARLPGWRAMARLLGRKPRMPGAQVEAGAGGSSPSALHQAIDRGELRLVYQPKLRLRSRKIVSVEALVRWEHPVRGLILPGDFIPAAERSGEIIALTRWVLQQAIVDQRRLVAAGHDTTVFINMAAALLVDDEFVADTCVDIVAAGASVGLEITETSVIRDPDAAIANLRHASDVGIPIAIDDYGAGLSSLAYLKQLPACELKIDKMFITELTSSQRDPLIVRSTIDLAHAMEMEVVAEGVESDTALALLSVMGCDMAQGYRISRPLPIDDLVAFIERHRDGWQTDAQGDTPPSFAATLRRAR